MRTFVALNVAAESRAAMHAAAAPLREALGRDVAWVAEPALHVTVVFLGEREQPFVDALTERLRVEAASLAPPELHVHGVGAFPRIDRPRVLWLGADLNPEVARLYQSVTSACAALGVPTETRPFHPHITIGRVREGVRIDVAALARAAERVTYDACERVRTIDVMESVLGSGGARYRVAASIPLGPGEGND